MGYFGKVDQQKKAILLRRKGHSIRFIEKKLNVSRSSASLWVKNVKLTKAQIDNLYRNRDSGRLKGSYIASQNKIGKRKKHVLEIENRALKDVNILSERDRFILGIALYFGEGSKTSHSVCFTNSDPYAVRFIKKWLMDFCNVEIQTIRCNLYLHDNLDEDKAKKYWSKFLTVPISQFNKTYFVKNNENRLRHSKHINGICRLTVSRIDVLRQILGWIKATLYV